MFYIIVFLRHDVLPVVMGARASEYAAVAPHNSYVHVEEFANAEELAAYLRRLDEDDTLYNSYFKWKVCLYLKLNKYEILAKNKSINLTDILFSLCRVQGSL